MKKFLLLLPLLFCLSSCWDYREPSAQNYVLGLGVDYEDKFILSVETVKITGEPTSLSSSEGVVIESEGITLRDAVQNVEAVAGKKLYWGHTELVILSESVAKDHLVEVCDLISRSNEIYSNVNLAVAKNVSAREILKAKTPSSGMISTHIADIFENYESSRRFDRCELWQLQRNFHSTLIPLIYLGNFPEVDGSAVIDGRRLTDYLTGEETQILLLTQEEASGVELPDIVIENTTVKTQVTDVKKDKELLDINISLLNSSAPFDTVDPENRRKLEEDIAELISAKINSVSRISYKVRVTLESSGLIKR